MDIEILIDNMADDGGKIHPLTMRKGTGKFGQIIEKTVSEGQRRSKP